MKLKGTKAWLRPDNTYLEDPNDLVHIMALYNAGLIKDKPPIDVSKDTFTDEEYDSFLEWADEQYPQFYEDGWLRLTGMPSEALSTLDVQGKPDRITIDVLRNALKAFGLPLKDTKIYLDNHHNKSFARDVTLNEWAAQVRKNQDLISIVSRKY